MDSIVFFLYINFLILASGEKLWASSKLKTMCPGQIISGWRGTRNLASNVNRNKVKMATIMPLPKERDPLLQNFFKNKKEIEKKKKVDVNEVPELGHK